MRHKTPLQKVREARGISQAEVARAVGLDQTTYGKLETAINRGRAGNAEKICKYFKGALTELHIMFPERYRKFKVGE